MRRLDITLLGTFAAHLDGELLTEFGYDKVRALLAYLALEGRRPQRRDTLVGLLWPEQRQPEALTNLRGALYRLRRLLHDHDGESPFLFVTRDSVQLHPEADIAADATRFVELAALCRAHTHAAGVDCPECVRAMNEAVALYRGELFSGFALDSEPFEAWLLLQREALHREALQLLERLAVQAEAQGAYEQVLVHARRQLQLEPWHEPAHRQVMRALALTGHRAAALAQYQACCEMLRHELVAEPEPDTLALYEQVRSGEFLRSPGAAQRVRVRTGQSVGPCPYRGLLAFGEADAPFFFGRDAFVDRLHHAITLPPHIVAVVGASGSGKSSVVLAGLLPALRASGEWVIATVRPGREPFQALAGALVAHLEPGGDEIERLMQIRRLSELLARGELPLGDVATRICDRVHEAFLLLVDQFEELYTLCPDPGTRERFIDTLLDSVSVRQTSDQKSAPVALVFALRADFMGQALTHRRFADALQTAAQMLGPMTREELGEVIEKPAASQGAVLEAGLVERLLNDVSRQPGNLPLLEFALTLLWDNLDRGWLTHAAYDAIGHVQGALTRYAQEVHEGLSEGDRALCRRVFTQLVQPGDGTGDTRRVATRAEVGDVGWSLVQYLADQRLVVTARDPLTGNETVEVVHEALIWSWQQLQVWMNEDRAFRAWQERLRVTLRSWAETEQDEGALLRGAPLVEAEGWLSERADELSPLEREYLDAAVSWRHRRDQEQEAQRHRELAAAEQLAEQRRVSAARLRRRAIFLSLALLVALMAAGLAGVFGRRSANLAQDNARIAEQESLARATAQAEAVARATAQDEAEQQREAALRQAAIGIASEATLQMRGPDQALAALLALEALEHYPYTWQAELALAEVVRDFRLRMQFTLDTPNAFPHQVSPDGASLLTASNDGILRVWHLADGTNLMTVRAYRETEANYHAAAWSPSGDRILTCSLGGGRPRVWDAQSGTLLAECATEGAIRAHWSPDGTQILSYGHRQPLTIWDAATGERRHVLPQNEGSTAQFSPDGRWVVTSRAEIWDAGSGKLIRTLEAYQDEIGHDDPPWFNWSPDGAHVGTGMASTARIWDTATGAELLSLPTGYQGHADLWWSPDGKHLLTTGWAGENSQAIVWDARTGGQLHVLPFYDDLRSNPWSPDGDRLLLGDEEGIVTIWDSGSGREHLRLPAHADSVYATWLSDGNGFVTSGMYHGVTKVWRISTAVTTLSCRPDCPPDTWQGFDTAIWSPDGTRLARPFDDGSVRVWDAVSRSEIVRTRRVGLTEGVAVNFLAWSPDGERILTGAGDGGVEIWDSSSGELLLALAGHGDADQDPVWSLNHVVMGVAWSPDGQRALTCGRDRRAVVWDTATGAALTVFTGQEFFWGAWSPDGRRVVLVDQFSYGGPVRIWDAETGEPLLTLLADDFGYGTSAVAWSPDGARIVTFSTDRVGRLWDAETGAQKGTFEVELWSFVAQWSPSGERFLIGGIDGIRVWDAATLQRIASYSCGEGDCTATWSPDGTAIAIGYTNGDLKVYPAWQSLEALIAHAKAHCVLRELTPEERARYGLPER
jgi:WD40 repeat protein/DNA-binding SARP family transcriptional activator